MIKLRIILCFAITASAACDQAPTIGPALTESERNAPFPRLLPLGTVLASGPTAPRLSETTATDLNARLANLRTRATALNRPVIDPATRATMRAAVARAALR